MIALDTRHVFMHQHADNKQDALQRLADILVEAGLTTPAYLQGLQAREAQGATYLCEGIAIPHGTPESRTAIIETGVCLVHFPQGVVWDDAGNVVYLTAVIAAKSDEHLAVLQLLTKALSQSENLAQTIKHAQSAEEILAVLNATPPQLVLHENLIVADLDTDDIDTVLTTASALLKQQKLVKNGFATTLNMENALQLQPNCWCVVSDKRVVTPAVSVVKVKQPVEFEIKNQAQQLDALICVADHPSMDKAKLSDLLDKLLRADTLPASADRQQLAQAIGATLTPNWAQRSVTLANSHGLHARPATALVKICQAFTGELLLKTSHSEFVSAKSLTKLLALGATYGETLTLIAEPNTEAEQGLDQVVSAIQQGLGETVTPITSVTSAVDSTAAVNKMPVSFDSFFATDDTDYTANAVTTEFKADQAYPAMIASRGLAIGQVYIERPQVFDFVEFADNPATAKAELQQAIEQVKTDLQTLITQSNKPNIQEIFTAHLALLDDPELLKAVDGYLAQGLSAPMAWSRYIDVTATAQAQLKNALLAARAMDLRDVGNKVLAKLCGVTARQTPNVPYILVASDIAPSEVAKLDENVVGIITAVGGANSHSAIVARALGIATLVGAGEGILQLADDSQLLLDAHQGEFYVNPNPARIQSLQQAQKTLAEQQALAKAHAHEPAITQDHHQVEVAVNIGDVKDTADAVALGAEAVGLLRTELVFMAHTTAPNEATQIQDYQVVLDALDGRPLVVRTLDVGGDKPLPYLPMPAEDNPFLGVRGIRLTLRRQALLREQLIALIKSAQGRPLRIMFPMVGQLEEWRSAKAILDEVLVSHPCPNLQVGIMVEVPSIAILAPILAKEVDFFSIGTNDLTQYTLAIDRGHPLLSAEADGLHPSILMLINRTVHAAHAHGKWVGVCGELASDPKAVPILVGLGVDELSVSATAIPLLKAQIRTLNFADCKKLANKAMNCATAKQVREVV